MKIHPLFLISLYFVVGCSSVYGQNTNDSVRIHVQGKVADLDNPTGQLEDLMVVNLSTQQGSFGKADGSFSMMIMKKDTLLIASTGYAFKKICFKDSLLKSDYSVSLKLKKLVVQLKEVKIFAPRDLESIEKDIQKLGYRKSDYELSGINALESPITFLYQEFSRHERLKRHNAEIVNADKRRNLLKELLSRFVADEIILLSNDDFDRFIDFCSVSESFMKRSTQYEFMVYIKQKYKLFSELHDYYRER
ncbi:MAG: hypothetical protein NT126_11455 [Bacteroidetes bacterium]|nr:hypothetical protein [Bacteroidota bacterium]